MSAQRRMDDTHGRERPRAYGEAPTSGAGRSRARSGIALTAATVLTAAVLGLIGLAILGGEDTLVSALGAGVGAIALLAGATLAWSLVTLGREHEALVRREADALRMAELDDLTGLGNYRMFMRQLTAEVARSRRYEDPFSLVLLDLDGFKAINDELGHLAGDDALRLVAVALRDALREEDVCCRQGGDEFAVIAVRAGEQEAHELAERLARAIAEIPFGPDGARRLGAGVGWATFGAPARSVDELILRADAALRQTKRINGGARSVAPSRAGTAGESQLARDGRGRAGTGVGAGATNRLALLTGLARALADSAQRAHARGDDGRVPRGSVRHRRRRRRGARRRRQRAAGDERFGRSAGLRRRGAVDSADRAAGARCRRPAPWSKRAPSRRGRASWRSRSARRRARGATSRSPPTGRTPTS